MSDPKPIRAANGVYYIHWTEGRRSKRVSTRQTDYREAQKFLTTWLDLRGSDPDVDVGKLTLTELWAVYVEKHVETRTVTANQFASTWRRLEPHFGDLRPAQINQDSVDAYVRKRETGIIGRPACAGSCRTEVAKIQACLNWCAHPRRKLVNKTDLVGFDLPAASDARDRWLSIPEMQRLLDAARALRPGQALSRGEIFLWLAIETAARQEAIRQLTWDRVDFETGVIHYNVPGRRITKKRRTSPPISSALRPMLERAHRERTGPLVLGSTAAVNAVVDRIAAAASVPGVTPHVLRHTAATQMARRGVPIAHIADLLGNTIAMTEKVYRHHCPDATRRAVEHISAGLLEAAE